jgi:hypothetical protein
MKRERGRKGIGGTNVHGLVGLGRVEKEALDDLHLGFQEAGLLGAQSSVGASGLLLDATGNG